MKKGIRKRCLAVALSMVLTFMDNVPALAKESGFLENETIVATEEEVRSEDDILNRMTYEEDISTCENETVVQSNVTEESSFAEGTNGSTEEKSNLTEEGSSLVEESSSIEESAILSEEDTVQDDSAINEEISFILANQYTAPSVIFIVQLSTDSIIPLTLFVSLST